MIEYQNEIKIYFICKGTSTNDIIDSINNINKSKDITDDLKQKGFFEGILNKIIGKDNIKKINIEREKFSKLDEIGIKEMLLCQNNNKKLLNSMNNIYTSVEVNAIESSSILFKDIILPSKSSLRIYPIPYIPDHSGIKNNTDLYDLKKIFGNYIIEKNPIKNETLITNYWNNKNINNNFTEIKNLNQILDWSNISDINSLLNKYTYNNFKKFFHMKCAELLLSYSKKEKHKNIAIICNNILLNDVLSKFKKIKFYKEKDIIERSSIWEIIIDGKICYNLGSLNIVSKKFKYNRFNKIYPLKKHINLNNLNDFKYSYSFNDNKFILFNSLNNISLEYLKKMSFRRFTLIKKKMIREILKEYDKNNKINKNNKTYKNNNKLRFENLLNN